LSLVSDLPQGSQLIGPPHADHAYETRRFEAMPRRMIRTQRAPAAMCDGDGCATGRWLESDVDFGVLMRGEVTLT
jgi:hypothetical protein